MSRADEVVCRGLRFRDEDDAYDYFRQQEVDAADDRLVDELIYANYAHNRAASPEVPVERWQLIYGASTPAMEARYQAAIKGAA